jgi:uncharacterized protein (DUF2141 family)
MSQFLFSMNSSRLIALSLAIGGLSSFSSSSSSGAMATPPAQASPAKSSPLQASRTQASQPGTPSTRSASAASPTPAASSQPAPAKSPTISPSGQGNLSIRISGLRNASGNLCLSLFNRAEGFPAHPNTDVKSQCVPAKQASRIRFERLPYGDYAIAVLHDENSDGKVNSGLFGVPQEGFGFSRNPKITLRSPSFQETAIDLNSREQNVPIRLNYF